MYTMRLAALFLASCASTGILAGTAKAETSPDGERFRVLFERGNSTMPAGGPEALANAAAVKRITRVLERIGGLTGVQFKFVASRPACVDPEYCDANRLTFARLSELTQAITDAAKQAGLPSPRRSLAFIFADEPGVNVTLPAAPMGRDELALFLERSPAASAGTCQTQVLFRDPNLPPIIGPAGIEPGIPLADAEHASLSPGSELAVAKAGQNVHAVWQDAAGRFRKEARLSSAFSPLPPEATRLYVMAAQGENPELTQFISGLDDVFSPRPLPPFLVRAHHQAIARSGPDVQERGVGDLIISVKPGTVSPAPKGSDTAFNGQATIAVCEYGFSTTSALDASAADSSDAASYAR
jgi:hypothetical protein